MLQSITMMITLVSREQVTSLPQFVHDAGDATLLLFWLIVIVEFAIKKDISSKECFVWDKTKVKQLKHQSSWRISRILVKSLLLCWKPHALSKDLSKKNNQAHILNSYLYHCNADFSPWSKNFISCACFLLFLTLGKKFRSQGRSNK